MGKKDKEEKKGMSAHERRAFKEARKAPAPEPRYQFPWVKWFAWRPVAYDEKHFLWLETVERRWVIDKAWPSRGRWQYRRIKSHG